MPVDLDYSAGRFWMAVLGTLLIPAAVLLWRWLDSRWNNSDQIEALSKAGEQEAEAIEDTQKSIDDRLKVLEARDTQLLEKSDLKEMDRRVQRLEDKLEHLPTHTDLTAVKVQVAGLTQQIKGMDNKLELIHQFLLNSKKE